MLEVLLVQQDKLAQQGMEQAVVIQYFLPLHLLVEVAVRLVGLPVLEKQAVLVAAAVTMVALGALGIPHQHLQVKAIMAERQMLLTMVAVAVVVQAQLAQQLPLPLLAVMVVQVQLHPSLALALHMLAEAVARVMEQAVLEALEVVALVLVVVAVLALLVQPTLVGAEVVVMEAPVLRRLAAPVS